MARRISDDEPPVDPEVRRRIDERVGRGGVSLSQLSEVDLSRLGLDDAAAIWVVWFLDRLPSLTALDIRYNQIGEAGAQAIAAGLKQLTTLQIWDNQIGEAGAQAIAAGLKQLTTLDIGHNQIGDAGAQVIAAGLKQLTTLDIRYNQIGEAGAQAIAAGLKQLTTLQIWDNQIGEAGAQAIAAGLKQLTTLDIGHNQIGDAGAQAIAAGLKQLTTLEIGGNQIGDAGVQAIAAGLKQLTTLYIENNQIGEAGAQVIAAGLKQLTTLDIRYNQIGEAGAQAIAAGLKQLTTLTIGGNQIGDAGAQVIAAGLKQLTTLDIRYNQIGEAGAQAIAAGLKQLTTLQIWDNQIGDAGAQAIAAGLWQLTTLDIGHNQIGDAGARAIAAGLKQLTTLQIWDNQIGDAGVIVDMIDALVPAVEGAGGSLGSLSVSGNPLSWSKSGDPLISEEILRETNAAKLRQLLLDARPGHGESLAMGRAVLVGPGENGKTHLTRWLTDHPDREIPIPKDARTRGFEPWETTLGDVRLTIIDCGGQVEQLAAHTNLVLMGSMRSIYLLCLRADLDWIENAAEYYLGLLQQIRKHALGRTKRGDLPANPEDKVPVVIVVTYCDVPKGKQRLDRVNLNPADLRKTYPWLDVLVVDPYHGLKGRKVTQIRGQISEHFKRMPQIRARVTATLVRLRKLIRKEFDLDEPLPTEDGPKIENPTMTIPRFMELYAQAHDPKAKETQEAYCLRELDNLCDVIAPGVQKTADSQRPQSVEEAVKLILNPRFVNMYLYQRILAGRLTHAHGFISDDDFTLCMRGVDRQYRDELRGLLKERLVAFDWTISTQLTEEVGGLLIPDLLKPRAVPSKWDDAPCFAELRLTHWVGEPRFFLFISKYKDLLEPLKLTEDEEKLNPRPTGVFRNECMLRDPKYGCDALVQWDVVKREATVSVRPTDPGAKGVTPDPVQLMEELLNKLTELTKESEPMRTVRDTYGDPEHGLKRWILTQLKRRASAGRSASQLELDLTANTEGVEQANRNKIGALLHELEAEGRVRKQGAGPSTVWKLAEFEE